MKTLIISASNVGSSGKASISMRTGESLAKRLAVINPCGTTELVDLRKYHLVPCDMCESCAETQSCIKDMDFNRLRHLIMEADELILVCPHYAPIPSKLIILFEKLEEMSYLQYCAGIEGPHPTNGKRAGIIAHGGMTEGYQQLYKENILVPITNVLECIGMKVINKSGDQPICFGVKGFEKREGKVTFDIAHDIDTLESALDSFIELYKNA